MADSTGWSCPECGLILAPSVTKHRCDPPAAGVPVFSPVEWARQQMLLEQAIENSRRWLRPASAA